VEKSQLIWERTENILTEDSSNAEAHWGVVLCRYGIEYVEDPQSGKRVPTCHRAQYAAILTDVDYLAALDNASDSYSKRLYEEEAKAINDIQKGILAIASHEEPFDIFICYKESTDGGSRTVDSTLAQDIYFQLTNDGFKVFFSRITLEDRLGRDYEPFIFNALNTAKVMLVIGTKKEYFEAVWVKNEWSRFLSIMKDDRSRLLIPCYRDIDPYDMPDELAHLQAQDMGKIGFVQDLLRGVKKVAGKEEAKQEISGMATSVVGVSTSAPGVESLMKRGWIFLEDKEWKQADEYFDKVLDIDPEHAPAYIGKLCGELKCRNDKQLANHKTKLDKKPNYIKALRFSEKDYKAKVEGYNQLIKDRIEREEQEKAKREQEKIEREYNELIQKKINALKAHEFQNLANSFKSMNGYKNTIELAEECGAQYHILLEQEIAERKKREELEELEKKKLKYTRMWRKKGCCPRCGRAKGLFSSDWCKVCKKAFSLPPKLEEISLDRVCPHCGGEESSWNPKHCGVCNKLFSDPVKGIKISSKEKSEKSEKWRRSGRCPHCGGEESFWRPQHCKACQKAF